MANVFAAFKTTKNPSTKLILLVDSSVELLTLGSLLAGKIRLRCSRATDKMLKLRKNIKIRGRYPAQVVVR